LGTAVFLTALATFVLGILPGPIFRVALDAILTLGG
jgi:hypothetical protein